MFRNLGTTTTKSNQFWTQFLLWTKSRVDSKYAFFICLLTKLLLQRKWASFPGFGSLFQGSDSECSGRFGWVDGRLPWKSELESLRKLRVNWNFMGLLILGHPTWWHWAMVPSTAQKWKEQSLWSSQDEGFTTNYSTRIKFNSSCGYQQRKKELTVRKTIFWMWGNTSSSCDSSPSMRSVKLGLRSECGTESCLKRLKSSWNSTRFKEIWQTPTPLCGKILRANETEIKCECCFQSLVGFSFNDNHRHLIYPALQDTPANYRVVATHDSG